MAPFFKLTAHGGMGLAGGLTTGREKGFGGGCLPAGKAPKYLLSGAPPPAKNHQPPQPKIISTLKSHLSICLALKNYPNR